MQSLHKIEKSPCSTQPASFVRKGYPAALLSDSLESPPQISNLNSSRSTHPDVIVREIIRYTARLSFIIYHLSSAIDLIVKNVFENKYFPRAFPSITSCISRIFFRNLPAEEGAN